MSMANDTGRNVAKNALFSITMKNMKPKTIVSTPTTLFLQAILYHPSYSFLTIAITLCKFSYVTAIILFDDTALYPFGIKQMNWESDLLPLVELIDRNSAVKSNSVADLSI